MNQMLCFLKKLFSPEFDEMKAFNYLPMKVILSIVDKFLLSSIRARNVELNIQKS